MPQNGITVDANIINTFISNEIRGINDDLSDTLNRIMVPCGIVITGIIESEWKKTADDGNFFLQWFAQMLLEEKIRYLRTDRRKLTTAEKKKLHNDYGLPRNGSHDIEYIKCAINTRRKYILTEDIDFYDPTKKQASPSEKFKAKNQRRGDLCRFLRSQLGITVGLHEHCCADLSLS